MALSAHGAPPSVKSVSENRNREALFRASAILVVDDEPGMRNFLQRALQDDCALVRVAASVEKAEEIRKREHFDLLIVDIRLPGVSGVEWLHRLRAQGSQADVIFITAYADLETAIEALRVSASDFVMKPFRLEQILNSVERCLERRHALRENVLLRRQVDKFYSDREIVGNSKAIRKMKDVIGRIAHSPVTVLIEGETGTGKELVARYIHDMRGVSGPFVPLNCSSISPELIESELFGHAKGAFTGATGSREGLFSFAKNGTLFLDEISEMPISMQAQLLRVLEDKTVRPVGSDREVPVNARVIAASNRHLADEVEAGRFRADLFYRLEVVTIQVPPLRERLDDIPELARHFVRILSGELGMPPISLTREEINQLRSYTWPGNVRELKNLLERCLLLGKFPAQLIENLEEKISTSEEYTGFPSSWTLGEVIEQHAKKVFEESGKNKSETARRLGISRKTLDRKLQAWSKALHFEK